MNTPITAEQFKIGNYRLRYGQALDADNRPLNEWRVWLWNGHYWQLLVRNCTSLDCAKHSASQELCVPATVKPNHDPRDKRDCKNRDQKTKTPEQKQLQTS